MISLRQRIFIAVGIILGLVLVVLLLVFFFQKDDAETPDQTGEIVTENNIPSELVQQGNLTTTPAPAPTFSDEVPRERFARQFASMFVERYSSYSSETAGANVKSVEDMVTTKMTQFIASQNFEQTQNFYGVTTKVIASSVDSISDTSASIHVEVQQRIDDATGSRVEQKEGTVVLVSSGETFLVDGLFWDN